MAFPRIAVPTISIIGWQSNPLNVALIEPADNKHGGRKVLVGGRLDLKMMEKPSDVNVRVREWDEEAGGKGATVPIPRLWAIKTDPWADVRESTLGKLSHGGCNPQHANIPVIGCYGCPDWIFVGQVLGTPYPKDGEAKRCLWFDLNDLKITANAEQSEFGANHDLVLGLYLLHQRKEVDQSQLGEILMDMKDLRAYLSRELR